MDNPSNSSAIANTIPIVLFDGGSKGNQGQGAAAAVLLMPTGRRYTVSQLLSFATPEEAEYQGLIIGLQKAQRLGIRQLEVKGNSDVVFNQINQLTIVTDDRLKPLYLEARRMMKEFERIALEWIPVDQNRSARKAVDRCIEEALGREGAGAIAPSANPLIPKIAQLLSLGKQVTDEDFRQLVARADDMTNQSLDGLRSQIPTSIQDAIALQWDGDDDELAEMYRWYLRGLPPEWASRKVRLDRQVGVTPPEKLPWEEALISPFTAAPLDISPADLFRELPPEDFAAEDVPANPLTPFYSLQPDILASNNDGVGDHIFADFGQELSHASGFFETWTNENNPPLPENGLEDNSPHSRPIPSAQPSQFLASGVEILSLFEPSDDQEPEELLAPSLGDSSPLVEENGEVDGRLTPSLEQLLEQIQSLPVNQKKVFAQALAKQPDLVNWILQAIVDKIATPHPP